VARGDHRFVPVLIEALRASQLRVLPERHHNAKVVALERLAGQSLGADWFAWMRWYESTPLHPPGGYHAFKARLLARIDPALGRSFAAPSAQGLRIEEIVVSGTPPPADALGAPPVVVAARDARLDGGEPVVGVALGGEARAYPLRWLDWLEVANDRLGGRDIAVAWCAFAASAMAFERDGRGGVHGDGDAATLAASGLVQRGVRLMVERESATLWNELTGRPASGANAAARLEPLPAVLTTWSAWSARNPETTALVAPRAGDGPPITPYGRYHNTAEAVFPVALGREDLPPKAQVYGVERGLRARAWALERLLEAGVVNDDVGGHGVALVATRGRLELEGEHPQLGRIRFSPGAEVRAYARDRALELAPGSAPDQLVDAEGRPWRATDEALLGPEGQRLARLPGTVVYWFAWQAFHPETELGAL